MEADYSKGFFTPLFLPFALEYSEQKSVNALLQRVSCGRRNLCWAQILESGHRATHHVQQYEQVTGIETKSN
jgi:hypothetical protein